MKIDNTANSIESHVAAQQSQGASRVNGHASASGRNSSLTSVDLNSVEGLLQLIVSGNEIRESVVNDIKQKLQTGEFLAKQSALETAGAILNL